MVRRKILAILLISLLAAGVLVAGCARTAPGGGTASGAMPKSLLFASDPIGTSTYVVTSGLASVMQKYTGIKVIVQPLATMPLQFAELDGGRLDLTLKVQGNSYIVFRGEDEFKDVGPRPLRQLGSGNANAYVWVTRPDTGIKTMMDMVGKKVAYLSGVSPPTTETFRLALEYYGIAEKVIGVNRASMDAAATALIEKKVDAIGGPYGSFAFSVKEATGLVVIPIDDKATKYVAEKRPDLSVVMGTYEAGYYAMPEKTSTLSRVKEIVASPRMSEETAYALTRAVYDHPEDTKAIHRDVGEFNLNTGGLNFGFFIPTHPGAVKYFKEKGVWTKEHDALQTKFLDEEKRLLATKKK